MPELANILIRNVTRVEPGKALQEVDVLVEKGRLVAIEPVNWGGGAPAEGQRLITIDGRGMHVSPGFIDLHTHLRDPGQRHKETISTGAAAAAAGGFTTIVAMANTDPPVDNVTTLELVQERARAVPVRVHSVGAVTHYLEGFELTDLESMALAGAVAFSDDGRNAYPLELATEAMSRARRLQRPVLVHAQDEFACPNGQVNPGVAARSGLEPWPCSAEVTAVERAIEACRRSEGRLHLQHLSCARSVELLAAARDEGLPVTAEAAPHHMLLTESRVLWEGQPDAQAKVNPPLRLESDRRAVVRAVASGLIDAIATDHAPHERSSKELPFARCSFGFSGLETALALCLELVDHGEIQLSRLVEALTVGPWDCLKDSLPQRRPGFHLGEPADLTVFESRAVWTVNPDDFRSMGKNTPLAGREMRGRVMLTIAGGQVVHNHWYTGVS
ncbi:MAG: dihydroorotase [Candidatus Dormibacteraeota bacterium]|nr:dihydroorotase [Candidatus Dormibacteraeota bacterium]